MPSIRLGAPTTAPEPTIPPHVATKGYVDTARRVGIAPVVLADTATIATNAALGNHFRVTLGGDRTLAAPTNAADGQKILWEVIQDGTGNRTLTLATGVPGAFAFGSDISTIASSTGPGQRDFIGAVYNSLADRWYVIAFVRGY